ncbi:MAG: hypothetical protein IJY27_04795 [Clostridia bacterium]|nr:hypothetical protein [Clostridia bacterium]
MWQIVFWIGLPALGFAAQFLLMRYTRSIWWRLTPTFAIVAIGIYALLRATDILEYPWDGGGFFDAGPLLGLVMLIGLIPVACGCLLGFILDRVLVFIQKRKSKQQ